MSTPHAIALPAPRPQTRRAPLLTALGLLVAIAASIGILALTGASHTTAPVTASPATSVSVPQIRYLGPQQLRAAHDPQTTPIPTAGPTTTPAASTSNATLHSCLGDAQRCLR